LYVSAVLKICAARVFATSFCYSSGYFGFLSLGSNQLELVSGRAYKDIEDVLHLTIEYN
jgi:hypothetical protein